MSQFHQQPRLMSRQKQTTMGDIQSLNGKEREDTVSIETRTRVEDELLKTRRRDDKLNPSQA